MGKGNRWLFSIEREGGESTVSIFGGESGQGGKGEGESYVLIGLKVKTPYGGADCTSSFQ